MAEHAKLSPSSAHRWMKCPGSIKMAETARELHGVKDTASDPALLGTALHGIAESRLLGHEQPANQAYTNSAGKIVPIDPDLIEKCVDPYVDFVQSCEGDLDVEGKLTVTDEVWGTGDAVICSDHVITVCDLKTGHAPVEAVYGGELNPQLAIYGLGAYLKYEMIYDFKAVELVISQGRIGKHVSHTVPVEEILEFQKKLHAAIARVKAEPDTLVPDPKACHFCPARSFCHGLIEFTKAEAAKDFEQMSLVELSESMERIPMLKAFIKGVEDRIKETLTAGTQVPGFKMVAGRKSRKWESEEAVVAYLKNRVAKFKTVCYDQKLKSPAQLEKALKKAEIRREIDLSEVVVTSGGNPTVVPEDDPREAMEYGDRAAEDFAEIAHET